MKRQMRKVGPREDQWRLFLAGIAIYLGIALTGVGIASISQDMRNIVMALERGQSAEDELLAEQSRLLLERTTLSSYRNVDQVAEQRLSMQFPEQVEKIERGTPQP
jgi:cell division protein FtsL